MLTKAHWQWMTPRAIALAYGGPVPLHLHAVLAAEDDGGSQASA